jgi:hypothetical protein
MFEDMGIVMLIGLSLKDPYRTTVDLTPPGDVSLT